MKLYVDENLSPRFRHQFNQDILKIYTYQFMGWKGKKNGELLILLHEHEFQGLITSDKLMYTDEQLKRNSLHFFLLQSAIDTVEARVPLLKLLNDFLTDSYLLFDNSKAS